MNRATKRPKGIEQKKIGTIKECSENVIFIVETVRRAGAGVASIKAKS